MTLDEAIERARWCANESTGECSEEHRQLAEWLTELRKLRATRTRLLAEIHGLKSQNNKLRVKCATLTRDNGMLLTRLEESGECIDMTEMVDYECEYYKVRVPAKSCLLCKWCTDVFWDYISGPYMMLCYHNADTFVGAYGKCDLFESESNDRMDEDD